MPDLGWLDADVARFGLDGAFVLLVPGSAASRPEKRWPPERYAALAHRLEGYGVRPVLIGTVAEAESLEAIAQACPGALDLTGDTSLEELAALARRATGAVGNDTGPMHLVALTGCPSLVLFSHASDPARHRPLGPSVGHLRAPRIEEIAVAEVEAAMRWRRRPAGWPPECEKPVAAGHPKGA
jgi:ADP-heptose:LPS heptosyltransferase